MSRAFETVVNKIGAAVASKVISLPARKSKEYEDGTYNPYFALADREGQLICIWVGNLRKDDKELLRVRGIDKGFYTTEDPKQKASWNNVTKIIARHFNLPLFD